MERRALRCAERALRRRYSDLAVSRDFAWDFERARIGSYKLLVVSKRKGLGGKQGGGEGGYRSSVGF